MSELKHVLSVEDDFDLRLLLQLALETVGGLRVTFCERGEQAHAQVHRDRPDLVLLDVMLPGQDGPATLRALRADPDTASIPVVFMTAQAAPSDCEALRALGAVAVIAKPFDPLQLAAVVNDIWNRCRD
jgi:two-component system, OmpR family, response regulator